MKIPMRAELLEELDTLPHPARIKRVRTLAKGAPGSREVQALIESLESPDAFEASLALTMAEAAGLEEHVLRALRHETVSVRAQAAKAACRSVTNHERLAEEILRAAPDTRRRLMRWMRSRELTDLADRLLPDVLARSGPAEAARLLPSCSPPI